MYVLLNLPQPHLHGKTARRPVPAPWWRRLSVENAATVNVRMRSITLLMMHDVCVLESLTQLQPEYINIIFCYIILANVSRAIRGRLAGRIWSAGRKMPRSELACLLHVGGTFRYGRHVCNASTLSELHLANGHTATCESASPLCYMSL